MAEGKARKGLGAVKDAMNNAGGDFQRVPILSLKDGDSKYIRFLTDDEDLIVAKIHNYVPRRDGNGGKSRYGNALCRKDQLIGEDTCPICATGHTATDRVYALVVEREPVTEKQEFVKPGGGKGKRNVVVGMKVMTRDVKKGDEEITEPCFYLFTGGFKNLFSSFVGFADTYGTLCDRDYKITRTGSGPADTVYNVVAVDPPIEMDFAKVNEFVDIDLEEYLLGLGDEDRMVKMFLGQGSSSDDDDDDDGDGEEEAKSSFDRAKSQLRGKGKTRSYEEDESGDGEED